MKAKATVISIVAVLFFSTCGVIAELVTFDPPDYPDPGSLPSLNGVDGWAASSSMVIWKGATGTFDGTAGAWNNSDPGVAGTMYRDFEAVTKGTLTYQVRPSNCNQVGAPSHWLLLQDAGGDEGYMLQLQARVKEGGVNTNQEFWIKCGSGEYVSPDDADIQFVSSSAWYEIQIEFDVSGATDTFDVQITRLDIAEVVWTQTGLTGFSSLSDVGRYKENGSYVPGGSFATWYDNIAIVPEPATMGLLAMGFVLVGMRRKAL